MDVVLMVVLIALVVLALFLGAVVIYGLAILNEGFQFHLRKAYHKILSNTISTSAAQIFSSKENFQKLNKMLERSKNNEELE